MKTKEKKIEQHRALKDYGVHLAAALQDEGVLLDVLGENALHVKGELTAAQKKNIRLWKRQLIDALAPKCPNCGLPMKLIENGMLWLCPFGCASKLRE